jgi:hypothetical protein
MTKFIAILGLAVIALLSPLVGKAQSVSVFRPSPFKIDKLSTRQDTTHTWVYGEITSNAKKEASTVYILVRWFDKARRVVAHYTTIVTDLAPGKTLPFRAFAKKNPDIIRYDVAIERVRFVQQWSESFTLTASLRTNFKNFRPPCWREIFATHDTPALLITNRPATTHDLYCLDRALRSDALSASRS